LRLSRFDCDLSLRNVAGFQEPADGSDLAGKALVQGLSLARHWRHKWRLSRSTAPWATQVIGEAAIAFPFKEYEKAVSANAAEILSKASEASSKAGVSCTTAD
jgi:hypothetical protein